MSRDAGKLSGECAAAKPRIFVSVAEQSADEHAADVVRAFRELVPEATFAGLTGPALAAAGCDCFTDMTERAAMAFGALKRVPEALLLLRRLKTFLRDGGFDAAMVVDSPALNLPIAKLCKRSGIPVLYYIAPQTWAWGPPGWRNRRVRARVDRLACLWPFEEDYFREAGIAATYVGHPTIDRLLAQRVDEARVAALREGASPVVALLPGSRMHVLAEVLPGQLEAAEALQIRYPRIRLLFVAANDAARETIERGLKGLKRQMHAIVVAGAADRGAAIRAADVALVASGTATLEVAFHATPMIVMYNSSRLAYHLVGRWLLRTPYLSIPNILAGREIVPEFMPYYRTVDPIVARVVSWLSSEELLRRVRQDLTTAIQEILKPGAAANTARVLTELLEETARAGRSAGIVGDDR